MEEDVLNEIRRHVRPRRCRTCRLATVIALVSLVMSAVALGSVLAASLPAWFPAQSDSSL